MHIISWSARRRVRKPWSPCVLSKSQLNNNAIVWVYIRRHTLLSSFFFHSFLLSTKYIVSAMARNETCSAFFWMINISIFFSVGRLAGAAAFFGSKWTRASSIVRTRQNHFNWESRHSRVCLNEIKMHRLSQACGHKMIKWNVKNSVFDPFLGIRMNSGDRYFISHVINWSHEIIDLCFGHDFVWSLNDELIQVLLLVGAVNSITLSPRNFQFSTSILCVMLMSENRNIKIVSA